MNIIDGSTQAREAPMGYALWHYTDKGWELKKNASVEGAIPSSPPQQAGTFVGQMRSTPSVSA
jgi:hypothetical protein